MASSEKHRGEMGSISLPQALVRAAYVLAVILACAKLVTAVPTDQSDPLPQTTAEIHKLIDLGRWPQAEVAARELLQKAEEENGTTSRAAADARDLLVTALIANARAFEPGTRELAQRAVKLRMELDGTDAPMVTESLLNQGKVFKENRQLEEAEEVLDRALAIRERELGPDHLEIARVLNELGSVAYRGRNPDLAETRYGRALAMLEATVGGDHPECAVSLTGLNGSMFLRRLYADAESYQQRSLAVHQRSSGPHHPLTAISMRTLGSVQRRMGKTDQAEDLLRRAADLLEESLGPDHPQTGRGFNSLAILVRDGGRYAESRDLFERALVAFETSRDPLDPRVAGVLNNLAPVYRELGDFTRAEACLRRSLAIREARYSPDHPAVAQSLGNLANVLIEAGRPSEAVPVQDRALAIKERVYGRSSVEYAATLSSLGRALRATGDLERAERSLEEAVAIFEAQLGPDNTIVADQLNNLAMVSHEKGDLDAARVGLLRAIEIRRVSEGKGHPLIGRYQYNLARVEADDGQADRAVDLALQSEASARGHLQLTARGLAEGEAIGFDRYTRNRLDLLLAFSLRWPQYATPVFDALIRSRGSVLDELVARRRAASADDPVVAALHLELTAASELLAKLSIRGAGKASPDEFREELASARSEVERLERALSKASAAFRDDRRRSKVGYDEVVHALPPGAALVGFTRRSIFADPVGTGTPDTFDYMALVLAPGASSPAPIVLGPAPEIDALVLAWRRAAIGPGVEKATHSADETTYRHAGEALRRRVWDPLVPLIRNAKTVFVVPDGELGLVNLTALPMGADSYLIEGAALIHMLDEERDLVVPPGPGLDGRSVLLALGDPDFDWDGGRSDRSSDGSASQRLRGSSGGCMSLDDVVFTRLPSTAAETAMIVKLWSRNKRDAVRLTGQEATEAELKRLGPGKAVLHLATHGFVLGERCEAESVTGRGIGGLAPTRPPPVPEQDSSLELLGLAGLALAGANHRGEAGPDEEDGVITAMEIAYLDLGGVDWAVLSACDSGVGESVSGEGVFGFRRAFRIAGARTVIMSLWPVEDASGLAWMEFLYRARLQEGMTTAESVQYASLELLRDRRDAGLSTHPFYWGAFIAAGDWR